MKLIEHAANTLRDVCHRAAKGWWNNIDPQDNAQFGLKIALIHSEVSEALEGKRKNLQDPHLPEFKNVDIELADALIRIFDLCGAMGINIGAAVEAKMAYNAIREDHKAENRAKPGGKQF